MPLIFTKDQIRSYLHHSLGYDVNETELAAFIHDLKRIVKHEDRKRRRKRLGHESNDTRLETTASTASPDENHYVVSEEEEDEGIDSSAENPSGLEEADEADITEFEIRQSMKPYKQHSPASSSSSKEVTPNFRNVQSQKENVSKPRNMLIMQRTTLTYDDNGKPVKENSLVPIGVRENAQVPKPVAEKKIANGRNTDVSKPLRTNSQPITSNVSRKQIPESKDINDSSNDSMSSYTTDELLLVLQELAANGIKEDSTDSSEIEKKTIKGPPDSIKRDPVALYHYYKSIWDKQKVPGENRHMKLRWNVRAQTAGHYPCINGQRIKYLKNK